MTDVVSRYVELLCHEINNPMTIIYGQAALLKAQLGRDRLEVPTAIERVDRVESNSVRVVNLVRELRDAFSEIEDETAEVLSLSEVLADARRFNERVCRVHDVTLTFDASTENHLVCVRPVHARNVLWRLMGRELQFGRPVTVRTHLEPTALLVTIASVGSVTPGDLDAGLDVMVRGLAADQIELKSFARDNETGVELRFPRVD